LLTHGAVKRAVGIEKDKVKGCFAEGETSTSENAAFREKKRVLLIGPTGKETLGFFFNSNGGVLLKVFGSGG